MANSYGNVSVDTTADVIIADLTERKNSIIYNNGTAIVYLGFDNLVTSITGMPIIPRGSLELHSIHNGRKVSVYGIAASGTQDIRYLLWDQ